MPAFGCAPAAAVAAAEEVAAAAVVVGVVAAAAAVAAAAQVVVLVVEVPAEAVDLEVVPVVALVLVDLPEAHQALLVLRPGAPRRALPQVVLRGDRVLAVMVPVLPAQARETLAIKAAREQTATLRQVTTRPEWKATRAMAPTLQPQVMQEAVKGIRVRGLVRDRVRGQEVAEEAQLAAAVDPVVVVVLEAPVDLAAVDRVPALRAAAQPAPAWVAGKVLPDRVRPAQPTRQAPPLPLQEQLQRQMLLRSRIWSAIAKKRPVIFACLEPADPTYWRQ